MGISNIFSRSFVILAPIVAEVEYPTPIILYTVLNIIACICSIFIMDDPKQESPATKGRDDRQEEVQEK